MAPSVATKAVQLLVANWLRGELGCLAGYAEASGCVYALSDGNLSLRLYLLGVQGQEGNGLWIRRRSGMLLALGRSEARSTGYTVLHPRTWVETGEAIPCAKTAIDSSS